MEWDEVDYLRETEGYAVETSEVSCRLGWVTHLKIRREDGKDGIPWDDLQRVKNAVVGPESVAVEFYPAEEELVNETNMRHLWVIPSEWLPFGLGTRR